MSPSTLRRNAIKELKNIKQFATGEELGRLLTNIDTINGKHKNFCVYGLLTKDCFSDRAVELIKKCTANYFVSSLRPDIKEISITKEPGYSNMFRNFSFLELYIYVKKDKSNIKFVLKHLS